MTIITSLVRTDSNLRSRIGDRESSDVTVSDISMSSWGVVRVACTSSLLLHRNNDTQTGCPWRCVAVSTISRQAQKSVFYIRPSDANAIEPLPQNCIIIPFRVRSLHPFTRTGTYRRGTIVESRRGPIFVAETIIVHYCVWPTPPTFPLSALVPST